MKQNNKNEKRKRKLRIAARKRKERLEYREKYSTSSPQNDEWNDYNLKLESNIEVPGAEQKKDGPAADKA